MWPEPKPLRNKLYGSLEELKRAAAFVRTTVVICWLLNVPATC